MSAAFDCPKCGEVHPRGCIGHRGKAPKLDNGHAPPCKRAPIQGGAVCPSHGGAAEQVKAKAAERTELEAIRRSVERLGQPIETDAAEALLSVLWRAAGDVACLAAEMATLERTLVMERLGEHHVRFKTHPTVILYGEALDRLAAVSASCLKLGLEERKVRMIEADARRLFTAVATAMNRTNLPADAAERFRSALAEELRSIGAPA